MIFRTFPPFCCPDSQTYQWFGFPSRI